MELYEGLENSGPTEPASKQQQLTTVYNF